VPVKRAVVTLSDPTVIARVSQAATASVRMRGLAPAVSTASVVPEYPVETRIATLRPVLRWKGDMSTEGVSLRIQDESGKEVWASRPNATLPPIRLLPGARYTWTVSTPRGAPAQARFETLPAEAVSRAEKARALAKSFADRVMHAVLLQDLGATHDAREAWAVLARERPDLPELGLLAR